ncbi:MAG: hypothetical protein R3F11_18835 [Verrucomicrobiales bacterium]
MSPARPLDDLNRPAQGLKLRVSIAVIDRFRNNCGEPLPDLLGIPAFAIAELNECLSEWKDRTDLFLPFAPFFLMMPLSILAASMIRRNLPESPLRPPTVFPASDGKTQPRRVANGLDQLIEIRR